ncbi:MAG: hypothetical protein ACE5QW_01005 [Thermoplasmata archaeon]
MPRNGIAFTRFCRLAHSILGPLRCKTKSRRREIADMGTGSSAKTRFASILGRSQNTLGVDRKSLEDNISFAGLGLKPEEVISGGRLALLLSLPSILVIPFAHSHPISLIFAVIIPPIAQRTVVSYPAALASRVEKSSFREAPEVTSYLIGGAGEALSHENAVLTAAKNSRGMLRPGFQRMVWLVYTKGRSLPEEFRKYAHKWRSRNEGFGETLMRLSGAVEEKGGEDLASLLMPLHIYTKSKLKGFLSSLRAPINVVFALGIILPVMIASILPMSSLAVASPTDFSNKNITQIQGNTPHPALIAVILDIIFPVAMFLYCREVLSRRPFSFLHTRPLRLTDFSIPIIALLLSIIIFSVGIVFWLQHKVPQISLMILAFTSMTMAFSLFFVGRSRSDIKSRKLSEEFPDVLERLGNFLSAGESLEIAVLKTAKKMEGTETARRFSNALFLLSRGEFDIGDILTRDTAMKQESSVVANLRMIVDIAEKDIALAGNIAKRIASNMKEVSRIERDAKDDIKPIVQTVSNTITFFSPLVLGVTASIFLLMETYFSESSGITSFCFILILGVLLYCNLAVASYFTEGLQTGDSHELLKVIGKGILLSTLIFSLSFLASSFLFGVL